MPAAGQSLPVNLRNRAIFYIGLVDPVAGEAVGPAGPTTSTRMDKFVGHLLEQAGLLVMIEKAERGRGAIEAIRRNGAAYLLAVGGSGITCVKSLIGACHRFSRLRNGSDLLA